MLQLEGSSPGDRPGSFRAAAAICRTCLRCSCLCTLISWGLDVLEMRILAFGLSCDPSTQVGMWRCNTVSVLR